MKNKIEYAYKKLNFEFEVVDTWVAGVMLAGWEVTALKSHNGDVNGSYCKFIGGELFLVGAKITPIDIHSEYLPHETQDRKLLLNKLELRRIREQLLVKGLTCVPVLLFCTVKRLWKMKIAVVRPKKNHDKRASIKERDLSRMARQDS